MNLRHLIVWICLGFGILSLGFTLGGCGEGMPDTTTSTSLGTSTTTATTTTTTGGSTTTTGGGTTSSTTSTTTSTTTTTMATVAAPTYVPASGTYEANTLTVTIDCGTTGATIYYTTDGSNPSALSASPIYTGPFSIEASKMIKAIATREGMVNSAVATAEYDLYWWQPLGAGLSDNPTALVYDPSGHDLYAGGDFFNQGTMTVNHVARWNANNSTWYALGNGTDGLVKALAYDAAGHDLYVGGNFDTVDAGGLTVNNVAKWNGSNWAALDNGTEPTFFVYALAFDPAGNLYVGGNFTTASGVSVNNIAKWNIAAATWEALGSGTVGTNGTVRALVFDPTSNNLYVGGDFTQAGGNPINHIARWDATGSSWNDTGGTNGDVNALTYNGFNLYAGGGFSTAGITPANYIARSDVDYGTWYALGAGFNNPAYALAYDSYMNLLYAGGYFTNNVAKWNSSSWQDLGTGTDGTVFSLACDLPGNNLYAGGVFVNAGSVPALHIAKWGRKL